MTREEFLKVSAYITAGCGKSLTPDSMIVYFDCLGDLPLDALMIAAKRVLMEHRWSTFPSIAELREAASMTLRGKVSELSPAEAWEMAWQAVAGIDPEVAGSFERSTKGLPPIVVECISAMGIFSLCYGKDPVAVVRGQFMKTYEQLAAREKRAALLPEATKKAIDGIGQQLPGTVTKAISGIGRPVE